jgi:hypothetical protein
MVLLPGCICCPPRPCSQLGQHYSPAESLELEIIAEDYILTETYETTSVGVCNLKNTPVSGRVSRPWSSISGTYSLTKRIAGAQSSYWRYTLPQTQCGISAVIDAYVGPDGTGLHELSFVVSYIEYRGCDLLNGTLSDDCTYYNQACPASNPSDPSTTVITESRKTSRVLASGGARIVCESGKWSGTDISVFENTFPELLADPGKPSAFCSIAGAGGLGPLVQKTGDSETGNRNVQIKNISFVF